MSTKGRHALATEVKQVVTLTGVAIWLLPKDASASNLVRGEEDMDPGTHGNG